VTDAALSDLLFVRQEPASADLALVFGAANEDDLARRTRHGVRLCRGWVRGQGERGKRGEA
jgi:hypothetical protein